MARLAFKAQPRTALPDNRVYDAQRTVSGFENRALLDVGFQIAENLPCGITGLHYPVGVQPELPQGVRQRNTGAIRPCQQLSVETSSQRPAAQVRGPKANPFLLTEANNVHCKGKLCSRKRPDGGDSQHDAEHAVVLAGIWNAIEMGADEENRPSFARTRITANEVADLVDAYRHARRTHQLGQVSVHLTHRR